MERRDRRGGLLPWRAVLALGLLSVGIARGETTIAFYSGKSFTSDSDLTLKQPGNGTHLRFQRAAYEDQSHSSPIYYGLRVTHFLKRKPWLGASIDFFHYKAYALTDRTVHAIGTEHGIPVDRQQRLDDTMQRFSISHGVNYLTLNVLGRLRWKRSGRFPEGRVQPYAGMGGGGLLLHPESVIGGRPFQKYEWNGVGYQLFAGVDYRVTRRWGLFVEYKFNRRNVNVRIVDGTADMRLNSHHLAFGTSYRL
jgi:opacity protein-like surface antigen